jgi:hypothetical protein
MNGKENGGSTSLPPTILGSGNGGGASADDEPDVHESKKMRNKGMASRATLTNPPLCHSSVERAP